MYVLLLLLLLSGFSGSLLRPRSCLVCLVAPLCRCNASFCICLAGPLPTLPFLIFLYISCAGIPTSLLLCIPTLLFPCTIISPSVYHPTTTYISPHPYKSARVHVYSFTVFPLSPIASFLQIRSDQVRSDQSRSTQISSIQNPTQLRPNQPLIHPDQDFFVTVLIRYRLSTLSH